MKIAYLDCFAGISGDMFLGALLDAGLDRDHLEKELEKLKIHGYTFHIHKKEKMGIAATKFDVILEGAHHHHGVPSHHKGEHRGGHHLHRGLKEIKAIISDSDLSEEVRDLAIGIFTRLGEAEAKVHGVPVETIHFHEVGAVDAIVDIVGAAIGVKALGVEKFYASKVPKGGGMVKMAHGSFPVPAPATLELLRGVPLYDNGIEKELVTPTGAAILTTLCADFGKMPEISVERVAHGAGGWDLEIPNVLRMVVGESPLSSFVKREGEEEILVLETNIDDMNPQIFGYVLEKVYEAGALEAHISPVHMKKNRPAHLFTVLCRPDRLDPLMDLIFRETSTLGIRHYPAQRRALGREFRQIETSLGKVKIKIAKIGDEVINLHPEYDSCLQIAKEKGVPLKEVLRVATEEGWKRLKKG